jgi:hypothetical protein
MSGTTETTTGDSLRDALSASLTQLEAPATAPTPPAALAPVASTPAAPAPLASAPAVQAPAPAAAPATSQEGVTSPAPGPARNPDGTFAKLDPNAAPAAPATPAAPAVVDPNAAPAAPATSMANPDRYARAPGSWTPQAREHWATIPAEVREEIWRRDTEVSRALTTSTQARKFATEFEQVVQPYLGFIAAEGSTPLKAFEYMMQTGALLRVGTPVQKAQAVAQIVKQYAIDLHALDSILAGQSVQENPQALVEQAVQRALAPITQQFQQRQHSQTAGIDQQIDQEIAAFASDPKNEFFNDVKDIMGDFIAAASQRGQRLSLTDAYERATLAYEPVRRVIEQRRSQSAAQQSQAVAQAARNAAVSIQPSAVSQTTHVTPGDSIRDAVEFAIQAHTKG